MPVLPREERAEDQAGADLARGGLHGAAPLAGLVVLALWALAFDLTLPLRLPGDAAWAEAAAALRTRARPGDAVQVYPAWAERARLFVEAAPLLFEEDLARADFVPFRRLWLLGLSRVPRGDLAAAEERLRARGATAEERPLEFRGLSLRAFRLAGPLLADELTFGGGPPEAHEVDYVARRCRSMPIGPPDAPSRLVLSGKAGTLLHLRAGVIGERAYGDVPDVELRVRAGDASLALLVVPATALRTSGWRAAEVPVPPGAAERTFVLEAASADPRRRLCVAAWTTL